MPQPPRRSRRSDPQLELGLMRVSSILTPPTWSALPTATQQTLTHLLTHLLTRLLVAHVDSAPRPDVHAGGAHER